jgi:hypothetical protein
MGETGSAAQSFSAVIFTPHVQQSFSPVIAVPASKAFPPVNCMGRETGRPLPQSIVWGFKLVLISTKNALRKSRGEGTVSRVAGFVRALLVRLVLFSKMDSRFGKEHRVIIIHFVECPPSQPFESEVTESSGA